jgi:pyruvate-ferredoxin/flavodoxin oxidoreductase
VACHNPSYITKGFPMVRDVKDGGTFLINCQWTPEELAPSICPPLQALHRQEQHPALYASTPSTWPSQDRHGQAHQHHSAVRILLSGKGSAREGRLQYMKDAATHSYLKKGQDIVDMNHKAIDAGATAYKKIDVPADWATAKDARHHEAGRAPALVEQVKNILIPWTRWTATACLFPRSSSTWTASSSWAPRV